LYTAHNVQVGATVPDVADGIGVVGIKQAATVPSTNPAAGGVILYADQGQLKWRDPSGNIYTATGGSVTVNSPNPQPQDQNYKAWSFDPALAANFTPAPTAGQPILVKVKASVSGTATAIDLYNNVNAAGFTANASYGALYDMNGSLLASTADLATTLNTSGVKSIAFQSGAAVTVNAYYYIWLVVNATTMPQFARGANHGGINQGLAPGTYRFANLGSSITSVPSSLVLANSTPVSVSYWMALS